MYLWARSAPARNAIVAGRNPDFPDGGSGLTNDDAADVLAELDTQGKTAALERLAVMHDALVDKMLAMRVANGLMTQDEATELRQQQPFYTPLKGFSAEGDMQVAEDKDPHLDFDALRRKQRGISPREYIRTEGRTSMPLNPLANLFADAENLVLRIEKNRATLPFLNSLLLDAPGFSDVANVYTDKNPKRLLGRRDPKTGKQKSYGMNMKANAAQFLVVKKDGIAHYIEFLNTDGGKAWERVFKNMTPPEISKARKVYRSFTGALKQLFTKFNESYLLRAPFRDMFDSIATAYSEESMPGGPAEGKKIAAKVIKYGFSPATWGATWNWLNNKAPDPSRPDAVRQQQLMDLYESMIRDGGSDGQAMLKDAQAHAVAMKKQMADLKAISKEGVIPRTTAGIKAVGSFFDKLFDLTNTVWRFATYQAALEAGIVPPDAARLARRSTVDLTRKGEWSSTLDDFYFFANPAIQSTIKQKQMFSSRNGRRVIGGMVVLGALTSLWNNLISGDDDDDGKSNYDSMDDTKKMANLVFFYGRGANDYLKMPMGFLISFPVYAGQKLADMASGIAKPEGVGASMMSNLMEVAKGALQSYSPVKIGLGEASDLPSSLVPSLLQYPLSLVRNKDYFSKAIYDEPDEGRSKASMGRETTGAAYKWFAQAMNDMSGGEGRIKGWVDFAPEQLRYLVNSLGGGPVASAKGLLNLKGAVEEGDVKLHDIPVIKNFLGSGGEYAAQNAFYDHDGDMKQIVEADKNDSMEQWAAKEKKFAVETDPDVIDAYKEAKKELRGFYERRGSELDGVDDPTERKRIIDNLKADKDDIYSAFNRVYNQVKAERQVAERGR